MVGDCVVSKRPKVQGSTLVEGPQPECAKATRGPTGVPQHPYELGSGTPLRLWTYGPKCANAICGQDLGCGSTRAGRGQGLHRCGGPLTRKCQSNLWARPLQTEVVDSGALAQEYAEATRGPARIERFAGS